MNERTQIKRKQLPPETVVEAVGFLARLVQGAPAGERIASLGLLLAAAAGLFGLYNDPRNPYSLVILCVAVTGMVVLVLDRRRRSDSMKITEAMKQIAESVPASPQTSPLIAEPVPGFEESKTFGPIPGLNQDRIARAADELHGWMMNPDTDAYVTKLSVWTKVVQNVPEFSKRFAATIDTGEVTVRVRVAVVPSSVPPLVTTDVTTSTVYDSEPGALSENFELRIEALALWMKAPDSDAYVTSVAVWKAVEMRLSYDLLMVFLTVEKGDQVTVTRTQPLVTYDPDFNVGEKAPE